MEAEAESNVVTSEQMPATVEALVLPPNGKGWLSGPQRKFVEENYLQQFCKLRLEDPTKLKDYAKTASNGLITRFGWRRPFNIRPMFPLDLDVQLSPEDALLKAATVARLYPSMLSWLGRNATKIEAPTVKQTWRTKDDPTSLLLNRLLGIGETSVKGRLPFQAWASSLPKDSELVREFTSQRECKGLNQRERMGLYASFFAKAFTVLPIEEQALWKDRVEQEKAETREQRETATAKLGVLLPPTDALQLMDRLPKILGPVCESFAAMASVAVCVIFGGPDPREGGKSAVKSFSYGETKASIPEKFSGNQARFDRCMLAFSEFVAECFDEDDEAARALPFPDEPEMHEEPSRNRRVAYMEIDPKARSTNEVVGSEPRGSKKSSKTGEVDDTDTVGESRPKKQRKRRKGDGPTFATNDRGKKTTKIGPKTTMEPRAALHQITNSLAAVMGGDAQSKVPNPAVSPMAIDPVPSSTVALVTTHSGQGAVVESTDDASIDPVLRNMVDPVPPVSQPTSLTEMRCESVVGEPPAEELSPPLGAAADGSWLFTGIPITGPNDTPDPFAAPHLLLQHPMMPPPMRPPHLPPLRSPSPTLPDQPSPPNRPRTLPAPEDIGGEKVPSSSDRVPADETFVDAALFDASKWKAWFVEARGYLDQFELGHEWTLAMVSFTLWEGKHGFTEAGRSLPTLNLRPKQVGWWSQRRRLPVPDLGRTDILTFEKRWWSWWRALQPSWREVGDGEGPLLDVDRVLVGYEWDMLDCPGKNGMYSVLACLAWWKRGIDGLSGNKVRLTSDWNAAMEDVNWVLTHLVHPLPPS
ncbi:uncharacterized protein ARMOST_22515 [Armillaria ostoyae]|uniref:Uncharacterized protein n=1 Tax=Armillaria ostoyae TaxID=47428 RepID=A0A284SD56_ARMOS|nr:uncharacterized protein ARMOST_22515 [Armillaria ostoyae]